LRPRRLAFDFNSCGRTYIVAGRDSPWGYWVVDFDRAWGPCRLHAPVKHLTLPQKSITNALAGRSKTLGRAGLLDGP
jgi:hypothetical protein